MKSEMIEYYDVSGSPPDPCTATCTSFSQPSSQAELATLAHPIVPRRYELQLRGCWKGIISPLAGLTYHVSRCWGEGHIRLLMLQSRQHTDACRVLHPAPLCHGRVGGRDPGLVQQPHQGDGGEEVLLPALHHQGGPGAGGQPRGGLCCRGATARLASRAAACAAGSQGNIRSWRRTARSRVLVDWLRQTKIFCRCSVRRCSGATPEAPPSQNSQGFLNWQRNPIEVTVKVARSGIATATRKASEHAVFEGWVRRRQGGGTAKHKVAEQAGFEWWVRRRRGGGAGCVGDSQRE